VSSSVTNGKNHLVLVVGYDGTLQVPLRLCGTIRNGSVGIRPTAPSIQVTLGNLGHMMRAPTLG
jgi:hypothetical protein